MNVLRTGICLALSTACLGVLGCDVFLSGQPRQQTVYVQPQPAYVEPQYVVVQQAPPALIVESRPSPPAAGFIWIDGAWNWNNQRYVWQGGRYERPPQQGVVWVGASYQRDTHRYMPGRWQKQNEDHGRGRDGR